MSPDPFERALLATLAYFDLWQHPLTVEELRAFLVGYKLRGEEFPRRLDAAVAAGLLRHDQGHYFLNDRSGEIVARRRRREQHARRLWRAARLSAHVMKRCPFVRGVAVSGELSKNSTDSASDIDFFVLVAPGRVWIVRAMLTLFKKTVLLNRKKFFCLNSFSSMDHLEIDDRNVYQAVEIATLKPAFNAGLLEDYVRANGWIRDYFPNFSVQGPLPGVTVGRPSLFQRIQEFILSPLPLDAIDEALRRSMQRVWQRRYPQFDETTRNRIFRSTRQESRAYIGNFEEKILAEYARNLERHGIPA